MNYDVQLDLCEALIARVARGKKGSYAIITPEGEQPELLVRGNRLKIRALWVKQGGTLWNMQTFDGNLLMRSSQTSSPGEFYLGDRNWVHRHSSVDQCPDVLCIALVLLPGNDDTIVGFKGVFNANCASAYLIQEPSLVNVLLWEGQQLELAANTSIRSNQHGEQVN